mmetsp:Transcript_20642/g.71266  ORF Transcript_20642/g.71266 Transcript_20642/m.71266 type:complete len:237 (+) Transcript_20642:623-1333(+)
MQRPQRIFFDGPSGSGARLGRRAAAELDVARGQRTVRLDLPNRGQRGRLFQSPSSFGGGPIKDGYGRQGVRFGGAEEQGVVPPRRARSEGAEVVGMDKIRRFNSAFHRGQRHGLYLERRQQAAPVGPHCLAAHGPRRPRRHRRGVAGVRVSFGDEERRHGFQRLVEEKTHLHREERQRRLGPPRCSAFGGDGVLAPRTASFLADAPPCFCEKRALRFVRRCRGLAQGLRAGGYFGE